jgi:hypothetical protein
MGLIGQMSFATFRRLETEQRSGGRCRIRRLRVSPLRFRSSHTQTWSPALPVDRRILASGESGSASAKATGDRTVTTKRPAAPLV